MKISHVMPLLTLLLSSCSEISGHQNLNTQEYTINEINVQIQYPKTINSGQIYPIYLSYKNLSDKEISLSDRFYCPYIWKVSNESTGEEFISHSTKTFTCFTRTPPSIVLSPGETFKGKLQVITDELRPGNYAVPHKVLNAIIFLPDLISERIPYESIFSKVVFYIQ